MRRIRRLPLRQAYHHLSLVKVKPMIVLTLSYHHKELRSSLAIEAVFSMSNQIGSYQNRKQRDN